MDAFIFNYDLCQPVNMRVCIIGDWEWSVFLFSFSVGDDRFRFLPFFEGRRHDRQCMIAIKNPVCAPLTPVIVSFSWATPYPAFPGALSKPHCGESLNRGLIRWEHETDYSIASVLFFRSSKGREKMVETPAVSHPHL